MLSYNQIIKLNREFAEAHMVLKTFGNGEVYKVVKHSQQDWFNYPLMWMEDLPNPINDKEYTYTFRVYFIQQVPPLKDRENDQLTANYDEAKSDMISCARDLLAFWAKDSDYSDLDLIKNTVITTFEDDWEDLVTGCYVDLKLKQAFKYNKCAIPMTGITPPPSEACADANLNINSTSYGTISSGGILNLEVKDTTNTLVGFNDGGVWRVPTGGALNTSNLYKTGATSTYWVNDDGFRKEGRGVDFLTLDFANSFGNTNRFTDDLGTQIYTSGIVIDWSTYNQVGASVRAYSKNSLSPAFIKTHLTNAPYTLGSYSNWQVLNFMQLASLLDMSIYRNYLDYAPFNHKVDSTPNRVWCSTLESPSVANYYSGVSLTIGGVSAAYVTYITREYTLTELGL